MNIFKKIKLWFENWYYKKYTLPQEIRELEEKFQSLFMNIKNMPDSKLIIMKDDFIRTWNEIVYFLAHYYARRKDDVKAAYLQGRLFDFNNLNWRKKVKQPIENIKMESIDNNNNNIENLPESDFCKQVREDINCIKNSIDNFGVSKFESRNLYMNCIKNHIENINKILNSEVIFQVDKEGKKINMKDTCLRIAVVDLINSVNKPFFIYSRTQVLEDTIKNKNLNSDKINIDNMIQCSKYNNHIIDLNKKNEEEFKNIMGNEYLKKIDHLTEMLEEKNEQINSLKLEINELNVKIDNLTKTNKIINDINIKYENMFDRQNHKIGLQNHKIGLMEEKINFLMKNHNISSDMAISEDNSIEESFDSSDKNKRNSYTGSLWAVKNQYREADEEFCKKNPSKNMN